MEEEYGVLWFELMSLGVKRVVSGEVEGPNIQEKETRVTAEEAKTMCFIEALRFAALRIEWMTFRAGSMMSRS
jgi:hypothetical protein